MSKKPEEPEKHFKALEKALGKKPEQKPKP